MIIRSSREPLTGAEALEYIRLWEQSSEYARLKRYKQYYEVMNPKSKAKVERRRDRNIKPNNFNPTAYYKTLVDTLAGYMFQNVRYEGDETTREILQRNRVGIKDMASGVRALAYNRGLELVYTTGEGGDIQIKFATLDPAEVVLIHSDDIEAELFCAIRIYRSDKPNVDRVFDVIYANEQQTFEVLKNGNPREQVRAVPELTRVLPFNSVPVAVYQSEILTEKSSFSQIITYIDALDWVVSGNSNEIDRLADAILLLSSKLKEGDKNRLDELKVIEGMTRDSIAAYVEKNSSPEFRRYVSELLIQEIHKHSHVIDWYSPDTGVGGAASGRALKTRLFDMDMFSNRIEMVYRIGAEKRIELIEDIRRFLGEQTEPVTMVYERNVPSDLEDRIVALNQATFLSDETKVREAGFDWNTELERLNAQTERVGTEVQFDFNEGDNA